LTSLIVRLVNTKRIPQLISNPIPPGDITPVSASNAATPPIGNPYPELPDSYYTRII